MSHVTSHTDFDIWLSRNDLTILAPVSTIWNISSCSSCSQTFPQPAQPTLFLWEPCCLWWICFPNVAAPCPCFLTQIIGDFFASLPWMSWSWHVQKGQYSPIFNMVDAQTPTDHLRWQKAAAINVLHCFAINWLTGFSQRHRDIRFWCNGFSPNGGGPDSSMFDPSPLTSSKPQWQVSSQTSSDKKPGSTCTTYKYIIT